MTMAHTISVCDRETDIYEYLTYNKAQQQRFVMRASLNRQTETGQRLFDALAAEAPIIGTQTVPPAPAKVSTVSFILALTFSTIRDMLLPYTSPRFNLWNKARFLKAIAVKRFVYPRPSRCLKRSSA
jgi:hypothetical protein